MTGCALTKDAAVLVFLTTMAATFVVVADESESRIITIAKETGSTRSYKQSPRLKTIIWTHRRDREAK
jgi:hypothetical protein